MRAVRPEAHASRIMVATSILRRYLLAHTAGHAQPFIVIGAVLSLGYS